MKMIEKYDRRSCARSTLQDRKYDHAGICKFDH